MTKYHDDASGTNANAVATIPGVSGRPLYPKNVTWSYSDEPTGGRLVVASATKTFLDKDVQGAGFFPLGGETLNGEDLTATLYAGGSGIAGKVEIFAE